MAHTHALSGSVAFLAAAPFLHLGSPAQIAVGAVCAAGAGLLPDLDHHSATPAHAFGPASWVLSKAVAGLSGGHRHATHSLVGVAVFTAAAWWATRAGGWAVIVALTFLAGLGCRALLPRGRDRRWLLDWADVASLVYAAAAAWAAHGLVAAGMDLSVVPWAVAVGAAAHIAGDMLTKQGCALLWPLPTRFKVATITTDSWREKWLVTGALYLTLGFIAFRTWGSWSPTLSTIIARS